MVNSYLILILGVFFNFISQIVFAELAKDISFSEFSISTVTILIFDLLNDLRFWFAFCCFCLSALLWVIGLKKIALAKAFSIMSLNYILIFTYVSFILKEEITINKILSCIFIVCGVLLLAKNKSIKFLSGKTNEKVGNQSKLF